MDLHVGATVQVTGADRSRSRVRVLDLQEDREDVNGAVRPARAKVEGNGQIATLASGTCHLPIGAGEVQGDGPITKGYFAKSQQKNIWGLLKEVLLRFWLGDGSQRFGALRARAMTGLVDV